MQRSRPVIQQAVCRSSLNFRSSEFFRRPLCRTNRISRKGLGYLKTKDVAAVKFIIFIRNQMTNSNCVTCGYEMYR
ncbi:hypothetical protein NEIELOOT_03133 [Neisseria elongata subsp. glycolytica ATCC 29315]|uniref:Uncharacterized protein n=1 Tax=Neisseria elongata subsp. glycolytica ATCC 29315 TaxID=546263 RepID=D4DVL5_NEIEG|nr:hypothetical protein NEIELOOT_03133 [Neisseria elongata subsp. glycolytica ATCC 29315]